MPIEIYQRGKTWWLRGRIEQLPNSEYFRQSTGKTSKAGAQAVANWFENTKVKDFYSDGKRSITFSEAVLLYDATPEYAKALIPIVKEIGDVEVKDISATMVRALGKKLQPQNSTATWQKRVVSPVRAVINSAHDQGVCSGITIKGYKPNEVERQNRQIGKKARKLEHCGSWPWLIKFQKAAPLRVGLLAQFMFETGARISQALQIEFDDFYPEKGVLILPAAKGFPETTIKLSPELLAKLRLLEPRFTRRANGAMEKSSRLFGYLDRSNVYSAWKTTCRKANIETIMPHAAGRHGFGTEMLVRQGVDPVTVAKAGRWADIRLLVETYAHAEDVETKIQNAICAGRVHATQSINDNILK